MSHEPAYHPAVLPDRQQQAREISRLRSALLRDRDLFRGCANSCRLRNPGQAYLMMRRVGELDAIINPAAKELGQL